MSSVSDETEYNSTTPGPEFRAMESTRRTRHSSHSPAPYYISAVPALASVSAGIQPPPSNGPNGPNGPNCDTEAYVGYSMKDYGQETERLAAHAEYAHNPNISTIGMSSGYISPLPSVTSMPSTPMFPFDDEFMGGSFSAYPPPDGGVPSFPATSGYDSNMINALQSLSRLNDSQQQQIVAYIQKKRNPIQPTAADHTFDFSYGGYHVPVPRSSPLPGMKPFNRR
ncbi:hypothetical protein E0Z10_g10611 [Xylaria hypoxylon]|uniref:Uncharacterized protein n=1 Tax=Xylaria hypoxylon TaxID=37992 RepID=A0A4Z0YFY6_9PEZI|nr:hypothetical protein E0Z10_g10611 [Xylaria hypoxylon]